MSEKKRIVKKVLPEYFQDILDGKKKFELRLNDFDIEEGDMLMLKEYTSANPETREPTGRILEKKVLGVNRFKLDELWWSKEEIQDKGLQIISFD